MSMEDLNGSYFYGPHENEQWFHDVEKELAFSEETILRRELKRIQRSAKRLSIDKYHQYYFSITQENHQTIFNPVSKRSDGAVCVVATDSGEAAVCLFRGSLLCTKSLTELNENDLDYVSFLLGATNEVNKPEFYSRNGVTYYAEYGTFYEKSYLAYQKCWPPQAWEERCEALGDAGAEKAKSIAIYDNDGQEYEFIVEPGITLNPTRVNQISLQDEDGNRLYV